jgi:hypothetical protein
LLLTCNLEVPGCNLRYITYNTQMYRRFLTPIRYISGHCLKLGHGRFLPHQFQLFTTYCHSLVYTDSVVKRQIRKYGSFLPEQSLLFFSITATSDQKAYAFLNSFMRIVCPAVLINPEINGQLQNSSRLPFVTVTGSHCFGTSANPKTISISRQKLLKYATVLTVSL